MSLTTAFARHEWRTQLRSLRFRLIALVYMTGGALPAVVVYAHQRRSDTLFGAATYATEVLTFLPFLTALLGAALAVDGILREREPGVWPVVTMASLSNAGYLLRRFAALLSVVLPLTAVPLATAAVLAALAGAPPVSAGPFVGPWLLLIAPVAAAAAALALGLGTLADSVIVAGLGLALFFTLVPATVNQALAPLRRHASPPEAWLDMRGLKLRILLYEAGLRMEKMRRVLPASEGGYDARAAAEQWTSRGATSLGLALAILGGAALFLRRSRPDLRPWRIPAGHPVESFLVAANRLRQRYAPDPAPQRADRLTLLVALLALGLAGGLFWTRDSHYRRLAEERFAVETAGWPLPTPAAVVPGRFRVRVALARDGSVRSEVEATLRNAGGVPCPRLAFSLAPGLAVRSLTSERGTATARRRWDRLEVTLEPPLAAGEARRLHFVLAGTPTRLRFALREGLHDSFATRYQRYRTRRLAADLADLSASWMARAASPRRVELDAADLLPVPRFTSWALTPPPRSEDERGLEVPEERYSPAAELSVDLVAPARLWLADACGHIAEKRGGEVRLAGSCRIALGEWAVRGAELTPLPLGPSTFAVLPQHRGRAELHAATLAEIGGKIEEAWPGLASARSVLLEWPPPFDLDGRAGMGEWFPWFEDQGPEPEAVGRLLLIPERLVVGSARIPAEGLVAELVTAELLRRRPIVAGEQPLVRRLLRAVVFRRLGLAPATGAVLAGNRWDLDLLRVPVLSPEAWGRDARGNRLEAVVADLDHRVGASNLRRGIESFLARRGGPGTVEEMVKDVGLVSGVSLARLYDDYFRGNALPEMSLGPVRLQRPEGGDGSWVVDGSLANQGTGEAWCPVVVTTEAGPVETTVRVLGGQSTPYRLSTPFPPQAVRLDPAQVCHRFRPNNPGAIVERVELRPEAGR